MDDLLNIGHIKLKDFVKHFRPQKTEVVTYNSNGESLSTALDPNWIKTSKNIQWRKQLFSDP
jgi:hypothetical protein